MAEIGVKSSLAEVIGQHPEGDPELTRAFREDQATLLRNRVNVILLMGIFLVPLFGIGDYFLYPGLFQTFMLYRCIAASGCLVLYIINRSRDLGFKSFYLGIIAYYLVGLSIIKMIVDVDDVASPYYAGLNLVFIGFCAVLPVEARRLMLHCAVLYLAYLGLAFPVGRPQSAPLFLTGNMFVFSTLVIVVLAAHVNYILRWREYRLRLDLESLRRKLERYSHGLEEEVDEKQKALIQKVSELHERQELLVETQRAAIFALAKLAESRDKKTGEHLARMRFICKVIADELRGFDAYREIIDDGFITDLMESCTLHDLGKVAIPDTVLLKPGSLSDREYEIVKQHAVIGGDALKAIDERLGKESFIRMGRDIAYYHHEHYDGTGYPFGLRGTKIPLAARIVAVADAYDALTSSRCYKSPITHEQAVHQIDNSRNVEFDPDVVEAFFMAEERVKESINGEGQSSGLAYLGGMEGGKG
jgi:response regulator RpfG family c-di-GMP phosphodiesterase